MNYRTYQFGETTVRINAEGEPALFRTMFFRAVNSLTPAIDLRIGAKQGAAAPAGWHARGRYKGIAWEYATPGDALSRQITFSSRAATPYLALHIALLPALERELAARGRALVPGAAFCSHGGAMLLLGDTGAGKTGALLAAVEPGAPAIGDEYLSLGEGRVRPLFAGLGLRLNVRFAAPSVYRALSKGKRAQLVAARMAEVATGGRLRPLLHVTLASINAREPVASPLPVRTSIWLDRTLSGGAVAAAPADIAARVVRHLQRHDRSYGSPTAAPSRQEREARIAHALAATACWLARPGDVASITEEASRLATSTP